MVIKAIVTTFDNQALRGQINARRLWNPDVMWHQFEALLEMEPVGVELAYAAN